MNKKNILRAICCISIFSLGLMSTACAEEPDKTDKAPAPEPSSTSDSQSLEEACEILEDPLFQSEQLLYDLMAPANPSAQEFVPGFETANELDNKPTQNNDSDQLDFEELSRVFLEDPLPYFEMFIKSSDPDIIRERFESVESLIEEKNSFVTNVQALYLLEELRKDSSQLKDATDNVFNFPMGYEREYVSTSLKKLIQSINHIIHECSINGIR